MSLLSRPKRFLWVLGVVLLVGTVAGSGWFIKNGDKETAPGSEPGADFIVANGFADVPRGVAKLYPVQPGRVVAVYVEENDAVFEGDLLLSTDDRLSRQKLIAARAELAAARENVQKAEAAVAAWRLKVEQQQEAITGAEVSLEVEKQKLAKAERAYYNKDDKGQSRPPLISKEELVSAQKAVEGAEVQVRVQRLALKAAEALNPAFDLNRAKEDVTAKEA
jgi:multidrug resistance efflux pump